MKYRLLNFLICPKCGSYPLRLHILKEEIIDRDIELPPCDLYCGYRDTYIKELSGKPPCKECLKHEIIDGYLTCDKCGEWYPIIDSIVIMHLEDLRPKKVIEEFIDKYRDRLPKNIIKKWEET